MPYVITRCYLPPGSGNIPAFTAAKPILALATPKGYKVELNYAHTDSCIVTGCNLVQPLRKINMFIFGCSHIAVASQSQLQL